MCWLILSLFASMASCRIYSSLCCKKRRAMRIAVTSLMLLGEGLRTAALVSAGLYSIYFLPLHLCSLALFISFFHALSGSPLLGDFLYAIALPGAACALLFPDWTSYPAMNLLSINSFLNHILLVSYPVMLVYNKDIKPDLHRLPSCMLMLILIAVPIFAFDKIFDANYLFLNWPSPGSPLELFAGLLGQPGYLLGYIPMLTAVWACLYLPTVRKSPRKPHKKPDLNLKAHRKTFK